MGARRRRCSRPSRRTRPSRQGRATAALEASSSLVVRCLAALVEEPANLAAAVTPALLAQIGRSLIRSGESVWAIDIDPTGRVRLGVAGHHDPYGGADPDTWAYRISEYGPSLTRTRMMPAASVLHVRYPHRPDPAVVRRRAVAGSPHRRAALGRGLDGAGRRIVRPSGLAASLAGGRRRSDRRDLEGGHPHLAGSRGHGRIRQDHASGRRRQRPAGRLEAAATGRAPPGAAGVAARLRVPRGPVGVRRPGVPIHRCRRDGPARELPPAPAYCAPASRWHHSAGARREARASNRAQGLDRLFAADLSGRARAFQSLVGGAWTAWTPARPRGWPGSWSRNSACRPPPSCMICRTGHGQSWRVTAWHGVVAW